MNDIDISTTLAEQHRVQLQGQAERYRQVQEAKTGSHRQPEPTRGPRFLRWLSRSLRPAAGTLRARTATGGQRCDRCPIY